MIPAHQSRSPQNQVPDWKPFTRIPNAQAIADGLKIIPAAWSLTPVQDKSPKRANWQTENYIPHEQIAKLILHGERRTSQKGNEYTNYWSGFGLRTGEVSGGKVAVDVDGSSAQPLLEAIAGGDLPTTVSWTSGKPGRHQLLFQVPQEIRPFLKDFNRAVVTEYSDLKTDCDSEGKPTELLEFRYNNVQSVLPPSRHPSTGAYRWINSPETTSVAIAPQWLCNLLVELATSERNKQQEYKQRAVEWAEVQKQAKYQNGRVTDLVDFLRFDVLPRMSPDQIFNWSGHNFREYGKTLKGCPPWRSSASGTSFHLWWDGEEWAWQDKATSEGGGAVQYRWKLKGGTGTPKGKDFVEVVKQLADDAGVEMPVFAPQKGGGSGAEEPPITELSLRDRILEILSRSQSRSECEAALLQLAKSIKDINLRDLRNLAKTLEEEIEIGDNLGEAKSKVRELVKHQEARLSPGQVLYGDGGVLADLIEKVADSMPAHPEDVLTALIPVIFSRMGAETEIVISPSSGYTQPAIGQSIVVKATGEKKTPIVNIAIKPLLDLEAQLHREYKLAEEEYSREMKEYNDNSKNRKKGEDIAEELEQPRKPARKRFILSNCTIEALMRIHAENPDGLLQWKDEASSYITGRNKYRAKGAGDDLEIDLSLFSGGALVKDTVDESKAIFLEKSAVSRTGATQTERLKDLMKDHSDITGEFARWLFCALPLKKDYINLFDDSDYGQQLRVYLKDFYQLLSNIPRQQYFLDSAAKAVFQECQHKLVNMRDSEPQLGLKAAYPKFESYLARLSLWVHVANAALAGETKPSQMIDGLAVSVAWETVEFYMAQLQILYAKNNPEQEIEGTLLKIKNFVCDRNGVSVREIKRGISELKRGKTSINQIEEMCSSLIQDGFISQRDKKYYLPDSGDNEDKSKNNIPTSSKTENTAISVLSSKGGDKLGTTGDKTGDTFIKAENIDMLSIQDNGSPLVGTDWGQTGDKLSPVSNNAESTVVTTSGDSGDKISTLPNKKDVSLYNLNLSDNSGLSSTQSSGVLVTKKVSPLSPLVGKTVEPRGIEGGDNLSPELSPFVPRLSSEIDESIDCASLESVPRVVPICPQVVPKEQPSLLAITNGTRVRIIYPGSSRNGMTGTVKKVTPGTLGMLAEIRLDDKSLKGNLRTITVALPGDENQRLEVL
jgi:hypothetical protein